MPASTASAPELQKKTWLAKEWSTIFFATISCPFILNKFEQCHNLPACSLKAETKAGWLCPKHVTPIPLVKSKYLVPSSVYR